MSNFTLEDVNSMYFDVLKEIGNIGAGNATTAIPNTEETIVITLPTDVTG